MSLREKQSYFVIMLASLIQFAYMKGYQLTFPPDNKKQVHMDNSLHYIGLAQDLNLFRNGKYLTKTEDHRPLGEYWESIGGSWGGRFGANENGNNGTDGNHYSLEHNGRR